MATGLELIYDYFWSMSCMGKRSWVKGFLCHFLCFYERDTRCGSPLFPKQMTMGCNSCCCNGHLAAELKRRPLGNRAERELGARGTFALAPHLSFWRCQIYMLKVLPSGSGLSVNYRWKGPNWQKGSVRVQSRETSDTMCFQSLLFTLSYWSQFLGAAPNMKASGTWGYVRLHVSLVGIYTLFISDKLCPIMCLLKKKKLCSTETQALVCKNEDIPSSKLGFPRLRPTMLSKMNAEFSVAHFTPSAPTYQLYDLELVPYCL